MDMLFWQWPAATLCNTPTVHLPPREWPSCRWPDPLRGFAVFHSQLEIVDSRISDNRRLEWNAARTYGVLFAVDRDYDWGKWYVAEPRPLEPDRTRSRIVLRNTRVGGRTESRDL
jgi:hypothetical protein